MILSDKRITKTLISLRSCADWSAPLLFTHPWRQVFSRQGPNNVTKICKPQVVYQIQNIVYQFFYFKYGIYKPKKVKNLINKQVCTQRWNQVIKWVKLTMPVSESSGHCVLLPVKSSILLKLDSDVAGDNCGFGNLGLTSKYFNNFHKWTKGKTIKMYM